MRPTPGSFAELESRSRTGGRTNTNEPMSAHAQTDETGALSPEQIEQIRTDEELILAEDWTPQESGAGEPIVERLAWAGRLIVLAGKHKTGKSTLAGALTATASWGTDLFGPEEMVRPAQSVLYLSLEEPEDHLRQRLLYDCGINTRNVVINSYPSGSAIDSLMRTAAQIQPSLVVVDSLTSLATRSGLEPTADASWARVMNALVNLAHGHGIGVFVLHHGRRSDGRYRGSSAIGDAADMLLEMLPGENETERRIEALGRWHLSDYTIALERDEPPYSYRIVDEED